MADGGPRVISLTEAFRRVLRTRCRRKGLADEIGGYGWFHKRQEIGFQYDASEYEIAKSSLDLIKRDVKEQRIRLRGRLNGKLDDVDPIDAIYAEIDVFDNTLDTGKKIYTEVHCLEGDVIATAPERTGNKSNRAWKAAEAIWGPSGPPENLQNKMICRDVNEQFRKSGERMDINDATILRAVGRKR